MTRVNLTIELPDEVEREARESGLLDAEKLASIIQSEMRRQAKRRSAAPV